MTIIVGGVIIPRDLPRPEPLPNPVFWPDTNPGTDPIPLNVGEYTTGFANDINSLGQIVGYVGNIVDDNLQPIPVLWTGANSTTVPIPLNLGGADGGAAYGINNLGQIVGGLRDIVDDKFQPIPVLWTDANPGTVPIRLNLGGAVQGTADGINNLGQIVGRLGDIVDDNVQPIPVLWTNANPVTVPIRLNLGGAVQGEAHGINSLGQIVGQVIYGENINNRIPVLWTDTNHTTVPRPLSFGKDKVGSYGVAYGINNLGQIVGTNLYEESGEDPLPVLWPDTNPGTGIVRLKAPEGPGLPLGFGLALGISDPPPISNICFPAGTPVQTDQGMVSIELLNTRTHTINKNPIVHVTRTTTLDNYLIRFKPHALGRNMPHTTTLMTWDHKIMFEGQLVPAFRFLDYSDQVKKVKYNGETLYNVLLAGYGTMNINNLVCETLHPENMIAKLYNANYTHAEQDILVYQLNTTLKNKDIKCYKEVVN